MRGAVTPFLAVALLSLVGLAGCEDDDEVIVKPTAAELTREAVGHYCGMIVVDHTGPKAQIHLTGTDGVVWFSNVRDAIAFMRLPEEPKNIAVTYVNDMGRATWDAPEPGTWVEASAAWFVIESQRVGGMGAPEAVPFAERDAAEGFAASHGGRVVALNDIPDSYVLASPDDDADHGTHDAAGGTMDMPARDEDEAHGAAQDSQHGAHQ